MRFEDAEARGRDPWQATATRINAMRAPAKLAGMAMFLRELAAERPGNRRDVEELLALLGEPAPSKPATQRKKAQTPPSSPFFDLCASIDAENFFDLCAAVDAAPGHAAPKPKPKPTGESPMAGVLLAKKYKAQDPSCYWMSEKLDGVRAIWDGSTFWSRSGNEFNAPAWFREGMPRNVVLDGELFAGRKQFRATVKAVRRKIPDDKQWRGIRYLAFDAPLIPGPFEQRMAELAKVVARAPKGSHLELVVQKVCGGQRALDAFHKQLEAKGGEGVMLRLKGSPYEHKRSSTLLKVKTFIDDEARITGYQDGAGKHVGVLGAYHAELLSSGAKFRVGTGLTDKHRRKPLPLGTVITVRYFELTPDGKPRFPVFIAARDYE